MTVKREVHKSWRWNLGKDAGGGNWGRMVIGISWKPPREPAVHKSLVKFSSVILQI
jgi:hypothetical protein